jgi:hypothetical protein
MNYCVVTTINEPTKAIEKLQERFGSNLIVIGDDKTPESWVYKNVRYVPTSEQMYLNLQSVHYLPNNHYSRKNIGYLMAIKNKATVIYDTDDDNIPNDKWAIRTVQTDACGSLSDGWYNVYDFFAENYMWPRGFSLKHLKVFPSVGKSRKVRSSIQQGLSDGEPDVDAIWRLVFGRQNKFANEKSVYLQPKAWCPFNSQSTWWFPQAYVLMYLPIYATFRMADIWRSFVAQRCLWEIGQGVTFHSPSEVLQVRNEHDLLKDLESEVPGYVHNDNIVKLLDGLYLREGLDYICQNLITCYQALISERFLPDEEILSVTAWVKDYENSK